MPKAPVSDSALKESFQKTYEDFSIHLYASSKAMGLEDGPVTIGNMYNFATPRPKETHIITTPTPHRVNYSASTRAPNSISPYSFGSSPYSDNDADLQDTPRNARGLKYLTSLVKQFIHKSEPTSYTDVAM